MASVRGLKKEVNNMIFDVVEECYSIQLLDSSKKEKTDSFIDEVADYMNEFSKKVNAASTKNEYRELVKEVEELAGKWVERLNKLQN